MNRDGLLIIAGLIALASLGGGAIVTTVRNRWPGKAPDKYAPYIKAAEIREGIPHNLLARLLWQESRFREDIISGAVKSAAGAVGIAQIVPKWHPNVDPLNPWASIDYAAQYLRQLRAQFGTWQLALAAYNWGPGNLTKGLNTYGGGVLTHPTTPTETRNYVSQIWTDVSGASNA